MAEFRLLGPLEVRAAGRPVNLGAPKQRAVLAALAVDVGRPVSVDTMVDRIWGEFPPPGVRNALQAQVSKVRQLLVGTPARVEHSAAGYLLEVDPEQVDLHRFTRLTERARVETGASAADRAGWLRTALDLWRGPALADVPGLWADRARERYEQQRLDTARLWAELELGRGNPRPVIPLLRDLLGDHPLTEPLVVLLIRALHADGRLAEALDTYTAFRKRLIDDLGVEPGPELRAAHDAVLRGDAGDPAGAPSADVVPAQLPLDVSGFAGREPELADLDRLLAAAGRRGGGAATALISAIAGTAGVGKTALAVHWGHRVAERFADGQLYVDLRGYDPEQPLAPAAVLARFLRDLGAGPSEVPYGLDERAARYRSMLAGRRVLIVLDNASSVDQVRPLLPGSRSCFVLVTSRDSLAGLVVRDGARRIDLDLLPPDDANDLLRTLVGARVDDDPAGAAALAERCARLPLALRIAAELATARRDTPLTALVAELDAETDRLAALAAPGDERSSMRAVFSWSYQHLAAAPAGLFVLAGLHPGGEIDRWAGAALLGDADPANAAELLEVLGRAHLIEPIGPRRWRMHDLLRAYATELAAAEPEPARAALTRLLDYYRATTAAAMDALHPAERHLRPPVVPAGTAVPAFDSDTAGLSWLDTERPVLASITAHAADHGWPEVAVALASLLWRYLHTGGHHTDALTICASGMRAAEALGDRAEQATMLRNLGNVYWQWGRYDEAAEHYRRALVLHRQVGDSGGEARTTGNLGILYQRWGRYAEAGEHQRRALALFEAVGDRLGAARTLDNLGIVLWLQGRYPDAVDHHQRALAEFQAAGDRVSESIALGNLGLAYVRWGRYDEALDTLSRALVIHTEAGDRPSRSDTLDSLGQAYQGLGRYAEAVEHHTEALELARETGYRVSEAAIEDHIGAAYRRWGRLAEAEERYRAALVIAREISSREAETGALNGLGETLTAAERAAEAVDAHTAALDLATGNGDRYQQARAHAGLAAALAAAGDRSGAREHGETALAAYTDLAVPEAAEVATLLAALPPPA